MQILQRGRKDQDQIQAPLYIEADPVEKQEHPKDQISTLYAIDEDELVFEGEEYEYDETHAIHDENKIDEYWKQFSDFMQVELHNKYDLRLKKRSRNQENESEQQASTSSPKVTSQESQSAKQVNKGKQQQNANSKTQILQGESSQDQPEKISLEKLVSIPQVIPVMKKGGGERKDC